MDVVNRISTRDACDICKTVGGQENVKQIINMNQFMCIMVVEGVIQYVIQLHALPVIQYMYALFSNAYNKNNNCYVCSKFICVNNLASALCASLEYCIKLCRVKAFGIIYNDK